jgi:putative acetyltransferase
MIIRGETEADLASIGRIEEAAFQGPGEAKLVDRLRSGGDLHFSLVAEEKVGIIGHVAFSVMKAPFRALGLAPVAVSPLRQNQGVGKALINAGLTKAVEEGWDGVFVLGDPSYYQRFGFSPGLAVGFNCRYAGAHFMVKPLGDALPTMSGAVEYAPAFALLD